MKVTSRKGKTETWDPNDFRNHGKASFKYWLCWSSTKSLNIDADGNLTAGICKSKSFGNVYSPESLPKNIFRPFFCRRDFCTAIPDIKAKKKNLLPMGEYRKIDNTDQELSVNWDISRHCNFDCWYCTPEYHDKSNKFWSQNQMLSAWRHLTTNFFDKLAPKKINLHILGGEPTLHPEYIEFVENLTGPKISLITLTNGSNSLNYYQRLFEFSDITISIHFDFINTTKSIEKIVKLSEIQASQFPNRSFLIKIMNQPGKVETAIDFYRELKTQAHPNLKLEMLRLRNEKQTPMDYNAEDLKIIQSVGKSGAS